MGSFLSRCFHRAGARCGRRRSSSRIVPGGIGTNDENRPRSSSGLELIAGMERLDSSTLRRNCGNHFTLASANGSLEFVRGARRPDFDSRMTGVDENGFHFHHLIDTGGFGFVFKATRKTTGETYALKVQPMEFMARLTRAGGHRNAKETSIQMEKTALALCRGFPFIVSLEYAFHTALYAVLALEYVPGGTLSRLILNSPQGRLPCDLARIYTAEIALALNFMHEKGIIYRDVKPSNCLIDSDGHIKLTDFGLAGSMLAKKKQVNPQENSLELAESSSSEEGVSGDDGSMSAETVSSEDPESIEDDTADGIKGDLRRVRRRTLCGTAGYRPPEQVGERFVDYPQRSGYDERVDFFSLGVTCFTMLCGKRPFPTRKKMMSEMNEMSSISKRRSSLSDHPSGAMQRAATRALMKDIEFRCLMTEIQFPEFLHGSEAKSLIEQLLARDPINRPRINGIKSHPWMSDVEFEAAKLKGMRLPFDWVIVHAQQESKARPRSLRRNSMDGHQKSKTGLSLSSFIEDICVQMLEVGKLSSTGKAQQCDRGNEATARWMAAPSSETRELFRHWNYISDDALKLEMNANASNSITPKRFNSRRHLRRATQ